MPATSQSLAANAIANVRLESLPVTSAMQAALAKVAAGKMTTDAFLKMATKAA